MNRVTCWAWGAGWDSTAGIIEMVRRGQRPDLITFADVGGEKRHPDKSRGEQVGTYDFIPIFSQWLRDNGCPEPVICRYEPRPETSDRYRRAAIAVCRKLRISISSVDIDRLSRLYGNMVANDTLPGIAFNVKSCSIKWKLEAQEPI